MSANENLREELASSPPKLKKDIEFTVDWAIRAIARLGGYLEHRKNSAIGIQVLWRGWLELETLCQGWLLHQNLKESTPNAQINLI